MNGLLSNGERRSRVLVTITPYDEQEKRVLNTTTPTIPPAPPAPPVPPAPPAPPPLPFPSKAKSPEDSVEMQSIESFKLKDTPNPVIPKPPPTYFPIQNSTTNGSPRHNGTANKTQMNGKETTTSPVSETKAVIPPAPAIPQNLKPATGKVAIRIGAYEGEAKQPSKLDFLSQQNRSERNGTDELANAPVVSRLQNELAATLQRSNLRKKTDGEAQSTIKPIPENTAMPNNETTNSEPGKLPQSNVEKLASALNNKVTIKVNPDHSNR